MEGLFFLNTYRLGFVRQISIPLLNSYSLGIVRQTSNFFLIGTGGGGNVSTPILTVPTTGWIYPRTINL